MNYDAERVAAALGGRRSGRGWSCICPVHDDHAPSVSLADDDTGRLLVKCHTGCDPRDILAELRRRGLLEGRGDWREPRLPRPKPEPARGAGVREAVVSGRRRRARNAPVAGLRCERHPESEVRPCQMSGAPRTTLAPDPSRTIPSLSRTAKAGEGAPGQARAKAQRPVFQVRLNSYVDLAEDVERALILSGLPIYRRGNRLVSPVIREVDGTDGLRSFAAMLLDVRPEYLREFMDRAAGFEIWNIREKKWLLASPP